MKSLTATYAGALTQQRYALVTDRAICGVLAPFLHEEDVNPINARSLAKNRGFKVTEATLHAPKSEPITLQLRTDDQHAILQIPKLNLWGIISIR